MVNIKKTIRRIYRQKLNSIITVISLVIGFTSINLIANFISREVSVDSFHKDESRIYALQYKDKFSSGQPSCYVRTGAPEYMKDNFSQVEDYCWVTSMVSERITVNNQSNFGSPVIVKVSPNFFHFFSYDLAIGDPDNVLTSASDIVISEELAYKYFGKFDVVGETIGFVQGNTETRMNITGVFRKPINSTQLKFDILCHAGQVSGRCFVRLIPKALPEKVEALMEKDKDNLPIISAAESGKYLLQPLRKNYFNINRKGYYEYSRDIKDIKIALSIGLIILLVAFFNFMGLLNNKLLSKQKEIYIEMINGGSKWNVLSTILTENTLLMLVSLLVSIPLMVWILPFFNKITNSGLKPVFFMQPQQLLLMGSIFFILLIVSFAFSFFRLRASISPEVLKSQINTNSKRHQFPVFNVFQMASTIVLIICSIVIIKQNSYVANKPIGIDQNIMEVRLPYEYSKQSDIFREKLKSFSSIEQVSISYASPLDQSTLVLHTRNEDGKDKNYSIALFEADENYISTLGLKFIKGANFTGNPEIDQNKIVVNESFAKLFPDRDIIGEDVFKTGEIVIGIVKDYHYSNLKNKIEPAYISCFKNGYNILIKPMEGQSVQAREAIASVWSSLIKGYGLSISTIEEKYKNIHRENYNFLLLIGSCSAISILLSMIGLFSVAFLESRARIKEIGVRKVNGARVFEILTMLNKDFIKWVVIAFVIATPLTFYAMNKWLESFAYKTTLSWWIFAFGGLLTLGIALLTVSWQSWRAATRNPVEALRYE